MTGVSPRTYILASKPVFSVRVTYDILTVNYTQNEKLFTVMLVTL